MDYIYENFGDERFQEFCSTLISKEFPNAQVFPTGQPDGGRDTIVYSNKNNKKEFIVFQVKFVKNPYKNDIHKWLIEVMEKEAPKINRLIDRGATSYYLLTNVKGTAHLDNGTIDIMNNLLNDAILTSSMCWWREDLSRRFETDPLFKWSFPEILNGQDIINSVLFQHLNEHKEKRENIVKSYLADQYENDNEVKFKQIELQTSLFDIFTDVPIRIKKYDVNNRNLKNTIYDLIRNYMAIRPEELHYYYDEEELNFGAASFLLSSKVQNNLQRILLEGGPGQGKSTISQYICQVHRIKLMDKNTDILKIPNELKNIPIRLPIKVDLRDVAEWVENRNPYIGSISDEYYNNSWQNSLESFLITHFYYHSKFDNITSNDLANIFKYSPILLVFDGFDEIANIEARKDVIQFINKGLNRLSEYSRSIQVLITSRPAAFSNAIGFSIDTYPHFELADMNSKTTNEYVDKWAISRKLPQKDSNNLKKLVEDKLKFPHLKDLSKSPMQLAILLSLLSTRGESLPNKRTALYDSYIELFFNRESEKNITIRDNRDLIIDIHQYLAWVLHSEAQLLKNSGRIEIDVLNERLKSYLQKEGHNTEIAENLFTVMRERVCALVSRIQGTFEFEVQPLREYFCAKFLYKTSPYSPPGNEKPGTKTERFEAISRDPYWQNVTRFFAGCFDKGELPMIILKLNELQNDDSFKYTNHPRILTAQLLSDWVFSQYPNLLKNVIKIIINGLNVGGILNQDEKFSNEPISLPMDCGRQEVVEESFNDLKKFPSNDYAIELISLLKNNPFNVVSKWQEYASSLTGERLTLWLKYAYYLQIIYKIDANTIYEIIKRDKAIDIERVQIAINGRSDRNIYSIPELKSFIYNGILNSNFSFNINVIENSSLNYLNTVTNVLTYVSSLVTESYNISLRFFIERERHRYNAEFNSLSLNSDEIDDPIDESIHHYSIKINSILDVDVQQWKTKIAPWDDLINVSVNTFGYNWSFYLIAIVASGIKNKNEKYEDFYDLNDNNISLCKRIRYARLKSGNFKWWEDVINSSQNIEFHLLILFIWGTPNAFINLVDYITEKLSILSKKQLFRIIEGMQKLATLSPFTLVQQKQITNLVERENISDEVKYLISFRFPRENRGLFIYKHINENLGFINRILDIKLEYLVKNYLASPYNYDLLQEIKEIYGRTSTFNERVFLYRFLSDVTPEIPYEVSKEIMENYMKYPRVIASFAEKSCRIYANERIKPIGKIAKEENWFE